MIKYDLIVIGGGPAGLMAAGQAASRKLNIIILEKKHLPALKLGITGKGRCNLTNISQESDLERSFGKSSKFMRFVLGRFNNQDLITFFRDLGVDTVIERGGRVFPAAQNAQVIVRSLISWVKSQGAAIKTDATAEKIISEKSKVCGVKLKVSRTGNDSGTGKSEFFSAPNVLIATGGSSYPSTGSTGDGYTLAEEMGHSIVSIRPALVPLETEGDTAQKMQGLSLRNVQADIFVNGKKQAGGFGEMLFTHFGVSGPIILTLSKAVISFLDQNQQVLLSIDLKPGVTHSQLKNRIARTMHEQGKKKLTNILKDFLPLKMIPVFLEKSGLDPDKQGNLLTSQEKKLLRLWCKELRLYINGYRSFDEAIITSGGISLSEVNPRTMESRKIKGLYFAGEVLDIDAVTGGYNLQAAFSTGWIAGNSV